MTHDYADPYAVRCPSCCAPPRPDRDGRTGGFAHASWCRHAPRTTKETADMLTRPADHPDDTEVTCSMRGCFNGVVVDRRHAENVAATVRCHEHQVVSD